VAHDFNNLLTIITGYSQLILNNLRADDANCHSAEQIMKAGERAAALTRQLLAFSRRQVMQPRVLDLNKLVGSLGTMLQRLIGEDIDLRLQLGGDLGRVSADPGQLEQVIMNLVVNARDAMPRGGTLTIETSNVELDDQYAGRHLSMKPGRYVQMSVSDTGHGMDEATRARLFEPFFTTKGQGKGTGLGLSTVFGIVKQSGGNVQVYSEPERGASVKVYLPRVDKAASEEALSPPGKSNRGSETVLVVEDDDMVRRLVRETLEREGYKMLDAAEAEEARRIVSSHRGAIQLLITDVVLPKTGGRELAEEFSRAQPQAKVLFMSGYTDGAIVNNGILEKEVAFLQKPFSPATLAQKVREVLEAGDGRIRGAGE
jgi:two-component system, cell cycle sensor histidine kinase and response regulator CckA